MGFLHHHLQLQFVVLSWFISVEAEYTPQWVTVLFSYLVFGCCSLLEIMGNIFWRRLGWVGLVSCIRRLDLQWSAYDFLWNLVGAYSECSDDVMLFSLRFSHRLWIRLALAGFCGLPMLGRYKVVEFRISEAESISAKDISLECSNQALLFPSYFQLWRTTRIYLKFQFVHSVHLPQILHNTSSS